MASQPDLTISPTTISPTTSTSPQTTSSPPARGAEMRNFLQARLQKNRAPPLVHSWDFWHDRQDRSPQQQASSNPNPTHTNNQPTSPTPTTTPSLTPTTSYEDRLILLAHVTSIPTFWSLFNNFDPLALPLRDSIHLFKRGVKPLWEDPRNARGGAWTFRVPKSLAYEFWKEICLLAIGETLQNAVEEEGWRDDICGVSLGVRYGSVLVQVWNRDGGHEKGVRGVLEAVLGGLEEGLMPREGAFYYKRHAEHKAFAAGAAAEGVGEEQDTGAV